jgi:hypothetical protein
VCDLETSRIGAPYIYNVRLLRVKEGSSELHKSEKRVVQNHQRNSWNSIKLF